MELYIEFPNRNTEYYGKVVMAIRNQNSIAPEMAQLAARREIPS